SEEVAQDRNGVTVWTFHRTSPTAGHYTDERGFPQPRANSGAAYVEFVWSPEGWPTEVWYLDRGGHRRPDTPGVWGRRFAHDARGLVIETVYLGPRGEPVLHGREGHARMTHTHDAQGNTLDTDHFDAQGRLVPTRNGHNRYTRRFDVWGNLVEWRLYDAA